MSRVVVGLGCLWVMILVGCGGDTRPKLVRAKGTVLLDGSPLAGAAVSFQREVGGKSKDEFRRPSMGITNASGEFEVGTFSKTDGLPLGKYKVAIEKKEPVDKNVDLSSENVDVSRVKWKWITPRDVGDLTKTTLKTEVTAKGLEPNSFSLTSAKTPEIDFGGPKIITGP